MKIFVYTFFLLFLFTACGNGEGDAAEEASERALAAAEEAAYDSMIDGHDRVMPMLGQITHMQQSITEQLNQGGHGEEYRELLLAAFEKLEDADDGMMNWMNSVQPLDDLREEMNEEKLMDFIKERTRAIADVEADMKTSIATAENVLEEHTHTGGEDHDH